MPSGVRWYQIRGSMYRAYKTWFYSVSHAQLVPYAEVVQAPPPRPPNEEVIIDEDHAIDRPNTLTIIHTL